MNGIVVGGLSLGRLLKVHLNLDEYVCMDKYTIYNGFILNNTLKSSAFTTKIVLNNAVETAESKQLCAEREFTPEERAKKARVFFKSSLPESDCVKVRLSAAAESADGLCYIFSDPEIRIYEPTLRQTLPEFSSAKLTCLYEKSCGAVVFRRHSGNLEFLLVQNRFGSNWGFPKGHIEVNESEHETALREIREETGLNVRIMNDFRAISEYRTSGATIKQVVFFLAEAAGGRVSIQRSEIERSIWADYSLALRTFKYANDKQALSKAHKWLKNKGYV